MRQPNRDILPDTAEAMWDRACDPDRRKSLTVSCTLVTPMYGGGVKAGEIDTGMPIRCSALRGQLRYWWRLLNGTDLPSQQVFDIESELWGGISRNGPRTSQVRLRVKAEAVGPEALASWRTGNNAPYALILEPEDDPKILKQGYKFDLTLTFSSTVSSQQRAQVQDALRWWASFAGVGARTRRGLGAVKVSHNSLELKPVSPEEVESLGGWLVTRKPIGQDAIKAWKNAIDALKRFRQGSRIGRRSSGRGRPGRSNWPEADAIRCVAPSRPMTRNRCQPIGQFPRAAFGLPIVFHFKDKHDPQDHVLEPSEHERMASPLILRSYFDGEQYSPAALLLPGWKDRVSVPVRLSQTRSEQTQPGPSKAAWPQDETQRKTLSKSIVPLNSYGSTDVLSAFMEFFASQGDHR